MWDVTALNRVNWTHALAILRGAAEGDDGKYLASTRNFLTHAQPLTSARLVSALGEDEDEDNAGYHGLTDDGRVF